MQFKAGPLVSLSMSCASYLGIGHRIEFFGEDGTLVLHNPGADYMRGFELVLRQAARPRWNACRSRIRSTRNIPTAASRRCRGWPSVCFDAIENGGTPTPGFAEGYRVQRLIDMARRSHSQGAWIDVAAEDAKQESAP